MEHRDHELEPANERRRQPEERGREAGGEPGWIPAVGNAAATKLLRSAGLRRRSDDKTVVEPSVAQRIHAKRGGGRDLDPSVRDELGKSMGHDFSDVRVHTDGEADSLNRAVHAEAFTTGRDVFFRAGKYDAASNEGRKLLAHELTHVIQQRNAPPAAELTVSDPGDASERQAHQVADRVSSPAPAATAAGVSRAESGEDEEQVATSPVQREEEQEEQVATSAVQREEEQEEQVATSPVQREEEQDEEAPGA
jgi:hypothetical protein